jgi:predicted RNase H-like nuclease (RuvC/YqgF family)
VVVARWWLALLSELEKAFRETKEALDAEKRKALFIMEKEQKNIKQLQQERNSLKAQLRQLEQTLAEREPVGTDASGAPVYSSRDEEVSRLREEMREKQEALDTMKKDLETFSKMQRLIDQSGDSSDPAQVLAPPPFLCFALLVS